MPDNEWENYYPLFKIANSSAENLGLDISNPKVRGKIGILMLNLYEQIRKTDYSANDIRGAIRVYTEGGIDLLRKIVYPFDSSISNP